MEQTKNEIEALSGPFKFAFRAYRRPGLAVVVIMKGLFGATVVAMNASRDGEIPLEACFETFAQALVRSRALDGAAPSLTRWIEHRPSVLYRGRSVPEAWFEVKMRWDAKASRYRDARWLLLRQGEIERIKAVMEGAHAALAA